MKGLCAEALYLISHLICWVLCLFSNCRVQDMLLLFSSCIFENYNHIKAVASGRLVFEFKSSVLDVHPNMHMYLIKPFVNIQNLGCLFMYNSFIMASCKWDLIFAFLLVISMDFITLYASSGPPH